MRLRLRLRSFASRWRDDRGVAAVEFAFIAPVLLVLYLGGFELSQAMATYRKVSDTTVELANVAAQYTTMSAADVSSVMNASSQIMAPYATSNLTIVLSEVTTDANNQAKVTWSQPYNGATALTAGSSITLPTGLSSPSTNYILVQTTYLYTPVIGSRFLSPVPMRDQIYMLPRASASIPYTG
jgi:Flp pilus assembly protein TadG